MEVIRVSKILNREVRKYLYGVSLAALALAVLLGYVPAATAIGAVPLITALLNLTPEDKPGWIELPRDDV